MALIAQLSNERSEWTRTDTHLHLVPRCLSFPKENGSEGRSGNPRLPT
jgi:hypothetical protein